MAIKADIGNTLWLMVSFSCFPITAPAISRSPRAAASAPAQNISLIETVRANGHNRRRFLTVVLAALPNAASIEEVESLLAWNLTSDQADARYALYPKP